MNPDSYRAIMRHQAGAVTVIASGHGDDRRGLTATAVASLSDSPPTVLACVNRNTEAHDRILQANAFSINILASDQQGVAERFAGKGGVRGALRFEGLTWLTLATGAPILDAALASLDCELAECHAFTTHAIFIGRVVAGNVRASAQPLLYFRGDYWDVARGESASSR